MPFMSWGVGGTGPVPTPSLTESPTGRTLPLCVPQNGACVYQVTS